MSAVNEINNKVDGTILLSSEYGSNYNLIKDKIINFFNKHWVKEATKASKRNLMDSLVQLFTKGPGRMELNIFRDIYRIFQMNMDRVDIEYVESFLNRNQSDKRKLKLVWDRLATTASKLDIKSNIFDHIDERSSKALIALIYSLYKSGSFGYIIKGFKKQYPTMNFEPQIKELMIFFNNDKFAEFYKTTDTDKKSKLSMQLRKEFSDMAKRWSNTYSLNLSVCLVHYLLMASRISNGLGLGVDRYGKSDEINNESDIDIKFEDLLKMDIYRNNILTNISSINPNNNSNAKMTNMYNELHNGYNIHNILTVEITKLINKFILSNITGNDVNSIYESLYKPQTGILDKIELNTNIKDNIGKYIVSGQCQLMENMGYTVDDVIIILKTMIFPNKEMEFKQLLNKFISKR